MRSGNATVAVWLHDLGGQYELMAQRVDAGADLAAPLQLATVGTGAQITTAPSLLAYADVRTIHVLDVQPNGVFTPRVTYDGIGIGSIAPMADGGFIAAAGGQLRRFDASGNFVDSITVNGFIGSRLTSAHGNVIAVAVGNGPMSYVWRAPEPRTISSIAPVQRLARLASDGTNALLVWSEQLPTDHLMAQLVSASGQPLSEPLVLPALANGEVPAVGFDGKTYVLIRTVPRPGHIEIDAQRIARDGTIDGPAFLIADSQAQIRDVTIAGDTIAWIDEGATLPRMRWTTIDARTPMLWNPANEIAAATDGKDVMIAAATPVCGISIAAKQGPPIPITNDCTEGHLALAGNGDRWLLVYAVNSALTAQLLQHDGSPIGGPLLIDEYTADTEPRVAWDGDAFVVSWQGGPAIQVASVREHDVEQQLIPFAEGPQENGDVVFVQGGALMTYSHATRDATYSSRVVTRSVSRPRVRTVVR